MFSFHNAQAQAYFPYFSQLNACDWAPQSSYYCGSTCVEAYISSGFTDDFEGQPYSVPPVLLKYIFGLQRQVGSSWVLVGNTTTQTAEEIYKEYTITQAGTYRVHIYSVAVPACCPLSGGAILYNNGELTRSVSNIFTPVTANFKIDNQNVSSSTALSTYNCRPITLTNTSTGTQFSTGNPANFQYRILLTPTNADNVVIANPTPYPTSGWSSTALTSVDLRSVFPALNTAVGYYRVELQAKNVCNGTTASIKTGRIQVSGLIPTTIQGKFVDNTYAATITPGSSCAVAAVVGKNTPIFKFVGSTGEQISSYYLKIERYTSCASAPILVVDAQNSPTTITSPIQDIVIPMNSYIGAKTGDYNYWENNIGIYKITATFINPCGPTPQVFWVNNSGSWKTDPALDEHIGLSVSPNPFSTVAQVSYTLSEPSTVQLSLFDLSGRLIAQPLSPEQQTEGEHSIYIQGNDLPKGLYLYELRTNGIVTTGKLIKTE